MNYSYRHNIEYCLLTTKTIVIRLFGHLITKPEDVAPRYGGAAANILR